MPEQTTQKRTYRKRPRCPHCGEELTTAELGAMLSGMRTTRAGGRPRTKEAHCPCGAYTVATAKKRAHHCKAEDPQTRTKGNR
jgi:hypothetical protein